jgi:signal transduction histidine kinase
MRLRIILLAVAISSMILVSFLVPLALLLRTFQEDRAVSAATAQAQLLAPLVATVDSHDLQGAVQGVNAEPSSQRVTVFMSDGKWLGAPAQRSPGVQLAFKRQRSLTDRVPGGTEVLTFVAGLPHNGKAVIRAFVSQAQLTHGVLRAWLVLGGVGLGLVAVSVIVSAWLARSLVRPLRALAQASEELAAGDLSARAPFEGAPEIRKVSLGLNRLAVRIGELLAHERETVADLSHRLRTPLTALRIDAESLRDEEEMARVIAGVDDVSRLVNEIIREARRPAGGDAGCDVVAVVAARTEFWRPLAEDQYRRMTVDLPGWRMPVLVPAQDMAACLDVLLENVFAHTPEGTAFSVRVSARARGGAWLVVSDDGPGFNHPDPARRGLSSGGSTGLGLDIVQRVAEASGGTLTLGRSPAGGAAVTVGLGPAARLEQSPRRHVRTRPHLPGRRLRAEHDPQLAAELSAWAAISGRDTGPGQ